MKIKNCTKKKLEKDTKIFLKKKKRKTQYGHECYENFSEDEKEKLFEYRKKYYRVRKNNYNYKKVF